MKPLIARTLLATDFSHCANRASDYAVALATRWKAEVHVLHVLEFLPGMNPEYPVNQMYLDQLRKEATSHLDQLEQRLSGAGLAVQRKIIFGIPSQRIEAAAAELKADLIIMGTHGRTGLEHILVGSTAERVVRIAPCPVLSVKAPRDEPQQEAVPTGTIAFRQLLVPIDFSKSSLEALEYGVQLAKRLGSAVTILHVLEPVAYGLDFTLGGSIEWRGQKAHVESRLEVLRALCTANGLKAQYVLRTGHPADSIREYAGREQPDLVIMGTHGRRGVSRFVSGSVAEAMLRLAPCPVLTIRTSVFDAEHERIMPAGEVTAGTERDI